MCRVLGYHTRKPAGPPSPCYVTPEAIDMRALLFWHTYILDSCLSLRMGRPPAIQEWDIGVSVDDIPLGTLDPWGHLIVIWVHHTAIQNKLYKYLSVHPVLPVVFHFRVPRPGPSKREARLLMIPADIAPPL